MVFVIDLPQIVKTKVGLEHGHMYTARYSSIETQGKGLSYPA